MDFLTGGIDLLFPFLCPGCTQIGATEGFCAPCWKQLDFIAPPVCPLCGEPSTHEPAPLCRSCREWIPRFSSHRSLWQYGPLSRRLIFALKYGRQRYLARLLATWILPLVLPLPVHCIIPVPLHTRRLLKRGFNQCALIATHLSRFTGLPSCLRALEKITLTSSQAGLSFRQRRENVEGTFMCREDFQGSSILLLDDVYTTGATLGGCVEALYAAGANHVHAITLAKVSGG